MSNPTVKALFIYPIKSCAGLAVAQLDFDAIGPCLDRRWMVVDPGGHMLTQRVAPRLARIRPRLAGDLLVLEAPGVEPLSIPQFSDVGRVPATVWRHSGHGWDQGEQAARWFSQVLEQPARLLRWAEDEVRPTGRQAAGYPNRVAFADGYPLLVLSQASLDDLNSRMSTELGVERFRPNILVEGCVPYAEDTWTEVQVSGLHIALVKPCVRCVVTTIDQASLERGPEPLRTLARYRKTPNGVIFGQNAVHQGPGHIRVGAAVRVLSASDS